MNHEDWEDWLRWDPAAEPGSPDDEQQHSSASSKNDSPLQDPASPVGGMSFGKLDADPMMPPLIAGDEGMDFGLGETLTGEETFLFGDSNLLASSNFQLPQQSTLHQYPPPTVHKIDTNVPGWALPPTAASPEQSALGSAMSTTQHSHRVSSVASYAASLPSSGHSPEPAPSKRASINSNTSEQPRKKRGGGRKRKAESQSDASPEEVQDHGGDSQDGDEPPVKKTSHNVIEKRYRNNLNDKIVELRNSVPSLRAMGRSTGNEGTEDLGGLTPAHKLNKATVMAKATEYIKHLEKRNKTMSDDMAALQARLAAVEAAIGRSSSRQTSMSTSPPSGILYSADDVSPSHLPPSMFLNPAQDQTRYAQAMQPQYSQQQTSPTYARPPNPPVEAQNRPNQVRGRGGVMNKMMLGTMAGIMIMEGYHESNTAGEDTSDRALFSVPLGLFKRAGADVGDGSFSITGGLPRQATLPLLKMALIIGVLVYLLSSLLSFSPRKNQKLRSGVQLPQAPSLASPVEVRRKAWLTAIQTVWVPKHFLLEVVVVGLRMIQLSVRRLIGPEMWANITGTSKEEEAARIKAWDIAIDAQLAGGDAEVSYYRLLLTLMESGTLPDSPVRLMQKAVHFRVFFWEIANAGYGNLIGFKLFTEKVGKFYWDSARKLQKELVHARDQGHSLPGDKIELLPDHLARLGELDCEEVLSDEMIQRAWNLAWNKPSAYRTIANSARDSVVEDHAIRSPLDAVAAWYTNIMIDETLTDALGESTANFDTEYYVRLALSVAPPASNSHVRALTAKAVLSNSNREKNILAALDSLPSMGLTGGINLATQAPTSPDVHSALTIAKVISLCSPSSTPAARTRGFAAVANLHVPPSRYTLLTAVAMFRLLRLLSTSRHGALTEQSIEELAGGLRVWIGTPAGRVSGIDQAGRGHVVTLCLGIARQIGGWDDLDSGYGSEQSPGKGGLEVEVPA